MLNLALGISCHREASSLLIGLRCSLGFQDQLEAAFLQNLGSPVSSSASSWLISTGWSLIRRYGPDLDLDVSAVNDLWHGFSLQYSSSPV